MRLSLVKLTMPLRGPDDPSYHGKVPTRALYLAPDAAVSLASVEADTGGLVYSDIFRDAMGSLRARRAKSGVQPPAYSPHNYGIAFDVDVTATLRLRKWRYVEMREALSAHGWYCHRMDLDSSASESWHFNYFGLRAAERLKLSDPDRHVTWSMPAEAEIQDRYGESFSMGPDQIRNALHRIGYNVNPTMGDSIRRFQLAWDLAPDGVAGPKTQRTLAYVSAVVEIAAPFA